MRIKATGSNKKQKTLYATFIYKKSTYVITWRARDSEDGVTFDIGILPVKGDDDGSGQRLISQDKDDGRSN